MGELWRVFGSGFLLGFWVRVKEDDVVLGGVFFFLPPVGVVLDLVLDIAEKGRAPASVVTYELITIMYTKEFWFISCRSSLYLI